MYIRNGSIKALAPLRYSTRPKAQLFAIHRNQSALAHTRQWRPINSLGRALPRIAQPLRQQPIQSYISKRIASTASAHKKHGPVFNFFYKFFAYTGGFILVSGGLVLAFFAYDASTYREDLSYTDIHVSEQALSPKIGGPKNLPIIETLVDDDDCPEAIGLKNKPKLVILGSGWGSVSLLKTLHPGDYHITVVSPVNYFLFTPMLPSATVGTLELRSLVEPIRRIVQRARGHFLKADAVNVELAEKLVEVAQTDAQGNKIHFYLPYDKLVLGVGQWIYESSWNFFRLIKSLQARQQIHMVLKVSRIATS